MATSSKLVKQYKLDDLSENFYSLMDERRDPLLYNSSSSMLIAPDYFRNGKVILNARGTKFEILFELMDKLKNSRLAKIKRFIEMSRENREAANVYFNRNKLSDGVSSQLDEFFFNKDPAMLGIILNFYEPKANQLTHIHSINFCPLLLEDELAYWSITNYACLLEPCCMLRLEKAKEELEREMIKERAVIDELNAKDDFDCNLCPRFSEYIWNLVTKPKSSGYAALYCAFSCFMIFLAIADIVLRTIPALHDYTDDNVLTTPFHIIEFINVTWCALELLVKFIVCPNRIKLLLSFYTAFDIFSVIPYYVYLIFPDNNVISFLKDVARVFRVLTLLKFFELSDRLRLAIDFILLKAYIL
jgi:hypothetical protein